MQRRAALFLLACIPFFTACAIIPISKSSSPPPPFPSAGGGKVGSSVTVKRAQGGNADVTTHVTADQYIRLLAGRLPLRSALDRGEVTVDGDRARAENLNRLFAGVGG